VGYNQWAPQLPLLWILVSKQLLVSHYCESLSVKPESLGTKRPKG